MTIEGTDGIDGIDVEATITRGLLWNGPARRVWLTEGAIAASWQAQNLGVGPYPIAFLARCVRAMGLQRALDLPEPLIGAEPTRLAKAWMSAAAETATGLEGEILFAQWLENVARFVAVRRSEARTR